MFLFYGIFGLMGPLVGLVLIAASVHLIWRTVTLPRRTKLAAVCERCKYDVAALSSFTCPECGEDLRRVGIITPAMEARRRGSLPGAILAWTFLCGVVAYVGMMAFFMLSFSVTTASLASGWQQTLTPSSGTYQALTVEYESDGMSIGSEIYLELKLADGTKHSLSVDPGPMQAIGVGNGVTPWSPETIETWYAQAGLDTSDPAVAAAAQEVSTFIDLLVMSPSSGFNPNLLHHQVMMTTTSSPAASSSQVFDYWPVAVAAFGMLALLYILGLVFIVRRRRRLLRSVGVL